MFKKSILLCICLALVLSCTACVSKAQKNFEKSADEYFTQFKQEQTAGKIKKSVEYSKTGSVAYSYPETDNKDINAELLAYCNALSEEFLQKSSAADDSLLISYKAYSPAKDVYGIEMYSKATVSGATEEKVRQFNYGIELTDALKKLITIEGRDTEKEIKTANLETTLICKDGIIATYKTDGGKASVKVPFTKLRIFLPESITSTLENTNERMIDPTKKMVALTFDDGPHNGYSNKILDTLEEYNSVATFFEVGNLVSQGADTMKRADSLGCEIGSHTWSHGNLQTLSLSGIESQINKADAAFEEVLGRKPTLLRPPYGAVGSTLKNNCDKYLIGWSVDTNDWRYRDKDKIVRTVKNAGNLDGDVILMHSLYSTTAQATAELVPWLIDNGYQLVTISELIKYKYEDTLEAGKYYSYNYFDYE